MTSVDLWIRSFQSDPPRAVAPAQRTATRPCGGSEDRTLNCRKAASPLPKRASPRDRPQDSPSMSGSKFPRRLSVLSVYVGMLQFLSRCLEVCVETMKETITLGSSDRNIHIHTYDHVHTLTQTNTNTHPHKNILIRNTTHRTQDRYCINKKHENKIK